MQQITLITKNRLTAMSDIAEQLYDSDINIESIDAETIDGTGVITLAVDKYDEALAILKAASYKIISDDAIVVRLKDEPGALAQISLRFKKAKITLRSLRMIRRLDKHSLVAISTTQKKEALELVKDVLVQ